MGRFMGVQGLLPGVSAPNLSPLGHLEGRYRPWDGRPKRAFPGVSYSSGVLQGILKGVCNQESWVHSQGDMTLTDKA